jgi:electron transfer flavoprotein beta subunit
MALKIVICVKQVPDTDEIKIDKENETVEIGNVKKIINRDDLNALEEALKIKDLYNDTHITVITMGSPEAKDMLLECLALGADEAVLVTDKTLEDSDSLVTSSVLAAAINKIGNFDLILTGRQATGGDTAQVGPQLAEKLNVPQVTGIIKLSIESDMKTIIVKRALEDKYETIKLKMPCLLTAVKELNKPRSMSLRGILDAGKKNIKIMSVKDIEMPINMVGQDASPTKIVSISVPVHNKKCKFIRAETDKEAAESLLTELKGKYIV